MKKYKFPIAKLYFGIILSILITSEELVKMQINTTAQIILSIIFAIMIPVIPMCIAYNFNDKHKEIIYWGTLISTFTPSLIWIWMLLWSIFDIKEPKRIQNAQ